MILATSRTQKWWTMAIMIQERARKGREMSRILLVPRLSTKTPDPTHASILTTMGVDAETEKKRKSGKDEELEWI